jgi:hypothetical protein
MDRHTAKVIGAGRARRPSGAFLIGMAVWLLIPPLDAARAEADGPDHYRVQGVAANDTLKLRAAPNPKAAKVGAIPPHANCLRNLGCQGGLSFKEYSELTPAQQQERLRKNPRWCKVEYRGITGWVAGRFLAEGSCP